MKWVSDSPGSYRLVEDSDERPSVKLKSKVMGVPHTVFTPSWKKYEDAMTNQASKDQGEATDKFLAEREHAMKTDDKARRWEEGRKASWTRDKPYWIKQQEK
jgi:hypothetical protein